MCVFECKMKEETKETSSASTGQGDLTLFSVKRGMGIAIPLSLLPLLISLVSVSLTSWVSAIAGK